MSPAVEIERWNNLPPSGMGRMHAVTIESVAAVSDSEDSVSVDENERGVWMALIRDKIHVLQQGLRSKRRSLSFHSSSSSGSSSKGNETSSRMTIGRTVRRSISVHDKQAVRPMSDGKFKWNTSNSVDDSDSDDENGGFTSGQTFTRVGSLRSKGYNVQNASRPLRFRSPSPSPSPPVKRSAWKRAGRLQSVLQQAANWEKRRRHRSCSKASPTDDCGHLSQAKTPKRRSAFLGLQSATSHVTTVLAKKLGLHSSQNSRVPELVRPSVLDGSDNGRCDGQDVTLLVIRDPEPQEATSSPSSCASDSPAGPPDNDRLSHPSDCELEQHFQAVHPRTRRAVSLHGTQDLSSSLTCSLLRVRQAPRRSPSHAISQPSLVPEPSPPSPPAADDSVFDETSDRSDTSDSNIGALRRQTRLSSRNSSDGQQRQLRRASSYHQAAPSVECLYSTLTLPKHVRPSSHSLFTVEFEKGANKKSLGFSIVGGKDSPKGRQYFTISRR